MNAERLQTLMIVLETGSLSAAAEKLHFTPSGISRMMAALEEEMGFSLLVRGKDGVRATAELERLLPSIRTYLYEDRKLQEEADAILGITAGTVIIGCAYSGVYGRLEQVMTEFRRQYPGIQFQLRSGFSSELLEQLQDHEIDLCISTIRECDCEWKELGQDEMVLWVPEQFAISEKKSLPVAIVETEPYIDIYPGKDIDNHRILDGAKIRPNTQFEAMDSYTAYSMVDAGLGIAMNSRLNSTYTGGHVRVIPLKPAIHLQIGLAYRKDSSPAARRFLESVGSPAAREVH